MKLLHVLICTGILYLTKGLRHIRIKPITYSSVDPHRYVEEETSEYVPISRKRISLVESGEGSHGTSSFVQEKEPFNFREEVRAVSKAPRRKKKAKKRKKRKMRKVKVRPRNGRHIKNTYQNLRSVQFLVEEDTQLQVTTGAALTLEPVYNNLSDASYSQEELLKLCGETRSISQKFGITDISSFAGTNCALIRLYYPDVTCEEIDVFLHYCKETGAIQ